MRNRFVDIITMGCSKNLVDSEQLMKQFEIVGFKVYHNPTELHNDIAVVNTCGFIGDAKEESINMILELCDLKEAGMLQQVFVMGCLSERYQKELKEEIPNVDKFYGKFNWIELLNDLKQLNPTICSYDRVITTPNHYAYLKISEGCNRKCSYCAIPIITGAHHSRPIEEILDEVRYLVSKGVKEFQVIAQELTYYGVDLYKKQMLPYLIEKMAKIEGVEWIRLHYAYPTHFPMDLLRVIRENPNVCKYIDIALQHINDEVLLRMQRHITKDETLKLLHAMRQEVPGICIRTTLMVGFPNETDKEFQELLDFVADFKFDRLGVFAYSEEEGTFAALNYKDNVPEDVKRERQDLIMSIQEKISADLCAKKIGHVFRTIIDRIEGNYYIGRTEYDSPEVDCEVLIPVCDHQLNIGEFYQVEIVGSEEFDLYGKIIIPNEQ